MAAKRRAYDKPDANQADIVAALRQVGAVVEIISRPFDILCGYRGQLYLVEVKTPTGKLRPSQVADIAKFADAGVKVYVWRSVEQALSDVGAI